MARKTLVWGNVHGDVMTGAMSMVKFSKVFRELMVIINNKN